METRQEAIERFARQQQQQNAAAPKLPLASPSVPVQLSVSSSISSAATVPTISNNSMVESKQDALERFARQQKQNAAAPKPLAQGPPTRPPTRLPPAAPVDATATYSSSAAAAAAAVPRPSAAAASAAYTPMRGQAQGAPAAAATHQPVAFVPQPQHSRQNPSNAIPEDDDSDDDLVPAEPVVGIGMRNANTNTTAKLTSLLSSDSGSRPEQQQPEQQQQSLLSRTKKIHTRLNVALPAVQRGYVGLGFDDVLLVSKVAENGPASVAGIKVGDTLVTINGNGMISQSQAAVQLQGDIGTSVKLGLESTDDGTEKEYTLIRRAATVGENGLITFEPETDDVVRDARAAIQIASHLPSSSSLNPFSDTLRRTSSGSAHSPVAAAAEPAAVLSREAAAASTSQAEKSGVGLLLIDNGDDTDAPFKVRVNGIVPNSPAHQNGRIKRGDLLTHINGKPVSGSLATVNTKLIGEAGTTVGLGFIDGSNDTPYDVNLTRQPRTMTEEGVVYAAAPQSALSALSVPLRASSGSLAPLSEALSKSLPSSFESRRGHFQHASSGSAQQQQSQQQQQQAEPNVGLIFQHKDGVITVAGGEASKDGNLEIGDTLRIINGQVPRSLEEVKQLLAGEAGTTVTLGLTTEDGTLYNTNLKLKGLPLPLPTLNPSNNLDKYFQNAEPFLVPEEQVFGSAMSEAAEAAQPAAAGVAAAGVAAAGTRRETLKRLRVLGQSLFDTEKTLSYERSRYSFGGLGRRNPILIGELEKNVEELKLEIESLETSLEGGGKMTNRQTRQRRGKNVKMTTARQTRQRRGKNVKMTTARQTRQRRGKNAKMTTARQTRQRRGKNAKMTARRRKN